jgi:hypothetical protein
MDEDKELVVLFDPETGEPYVITPGGYKVYLDD